MAHDMLRLSFCGLLTAAAPEESPALVGFFQNTLPGFVDERASFTAEQADLLFLPISSQHSLVLLAESIEPRDGILILEHQGNPVIYFYYRDRIDFVVIFEQKQIKLCYLSLHKFTQRISSVMNFCIRHAFATRRQFLSQGAVLTKGQRTVWLTGPRLARKTMLMLSLLLDGWDFISDDKFILANQKAYLWDRNIFLRGHHLSFFPELAGRVDTSDRIVSSAKSRKHLLGLGRRFLPSYLQPLAERLVPKEFYSANVGGLFPDSKVITESPLSDVVILAIGGKVGIREMGLPEAIDDLAMIQRTFLKKHEILETAFTLAYPDWKVDHYGVLRENLKQVRCHKLTAPIQADFSCIKRELCKVLKAS